jgi:hypothetical protein
LVQIRRLIALGCSFTYGHGLPDCIHPNDPKGPGNTCSQQAWPNHLAKHLGINIVTNLARPGSSTKYALHALAQNQHLLNESSVVAIMYPHHTRSFRISAVENDHLTMNPNIAMGSITKLEAHRWRKAYDETDALGTQFLLADAIKNYVISKTGKPTINIIMDYNGESFGKAEVPMSLHRLSYTHKFFNDDNTFNLSFNKSLAHINYPPAADGHHPGLEWHKAVAQYLKNHLK